MVRAQLLTRPLAGRPTPDPSFHPGGPNHQPELHPPPRCVVVLASGIQLAGDTWVQTCRRWLRTASRCAALVSRHQLKSVDHIADQQNSRARQIPHSQQLFLFHTNWFFFQQVPGAGAVR